MAIEPLSQSNAWGSSSVLAADTVFQCKSGKVTISSDTSEPASILDGHELTAGESIVISSGNTVRKVNHNSGIAQLHSMAI